MRDAIVKLVIAASTLAAVGGAWAADKPSGDPNCENRPQTPGK